MLFYHVGIPCGAGGGAADYRSLTVVRTDDRNVQLHGSLGRSDGLVWWCP